MPKITPITKSTKAKQLSQPLEGELATYENVSNRIYFIIPDNGQCN